MQALDDIRMVALRSSPEAFRSSCPDPVLLLWQMVEGDLQFAAPGEFEATLREGNTLVHVPRVTVAERIRDSVQPGRTPLPSQRWLAVRVVDGSVPLIIGRERGRDLRLNDFTVSASHARIWGVPGTTRAWVEDADSRNGTAHNGVELVEGFRSELVSGDELVIGKFVLLFLSPSDFYRYLRGDLG